MCTVKFERHNKRDKKTLIVHILPGSVAVKVWKHRVHRIEEAPGTVLLSGVAPPTNNERELQKVLEDTGLSEPIRDNGE